jgi:hypothetical protein
MDIRNHWYWLEKDEAYADAFARAVQLAADSLEDKLIELGMHGYEEGVWFKGELVGTERRYLPTLLMAAVNAALPEKYRYRTAVEHTISDSMRALQEQWQQQIDHPEPPPRRELPQAGYIIDVEHTPVKDSGVARSQSKAETFAMLDKLQGYEPEYFDNPEDEPADAPIEPEAPQSDVNEAFERWRRSQP